MKFQYVSQDSLYEYKIYFKEKWIDIYCRQCGSTGPYHLIIFPIKNKKIIWDKPMPHGQNISQESKNYVEKLIKLNGFW